MSENENKNLNIKKILLAAFALIILSLISFTAARAFSFEKTQDAASLTAEEAFDLTQFLLSNYPEEHQTLKKLPYNIGEPQLDIWAKSAILIDVSNGNILYQKNADSIIPPASMTKLFAMYVVEEEIAAGRFSYDQLIPLPPESWACNMPPHSSLMFLGKDQRVTMEELLLGLSICSGNDAAYALAYTVSGTMEAFVERMNLVAADLGLANTHFVESSGYSEKIRQQHAKWQSLQQSISAVIRIHYIVFTAFLISPIQSRKTLLPVTTFSLRILQKVFHRKLQCL